MLRKTWLLVDEVGSVRISVWYWGLSFSGMVLITDLNLCLKSEICFCLHC